ncbi:RodZ family helix-turn-helix domain-containing protein [Pseudomonas sp.]|uniref:RodZ family helix-turn-helix domain-containing protein n=1 Tax=Pseudomonas sp. TaxID=306 RepID=UPI00299E5AE8|nr:RodZ family helix-turn-helix domain-containing protein [Pseudomonas sp.]MDX1367717.1 RodZ family helix-turn-helix domain-containing protein [Pseudomonas sp.]
MKAAHPEVVTTQRVNPGESLREARESKGWAVDEVAAQLNLTPLRLSQIEAGTFDKLPGNTFARGYVRAYAKLLGMDQSRLVLEFDQFTGSDAVGSDVHSLGHIEEPARYSQSILRFVSFALLLVLAGVGFYWWQEQTLRHVDESSVTSIEQVEVDSADGTTQIHPLDEPEDQAVLAAQGAAELILTPASTPETGGAELDSDAEQAERAAAATVEPAAEVAQAEPAPATDTAAASPAPGSTSETLPAVAGEGMVSINFVADCWTQVTDASGKVLFSELKRKGETLQLAGKAPLELRLGFARGAQVSYNGQAVDVTPHITGETARMKLGGQ